MVVTSFANGVTGPACSACCSPLEPPVRQADDAAVALGALLVQRREPLVEPRRHVGEVRGEVRVHQLVHERAAAGRDVHHQRAVLDEA